jgi:hypothetical protein
MSPADIARKWVQRRQGREDGIPSWMLFPLDVTWAERLLGEPPGTYFQDPIDMEIRKMQACRTAFMDQMVTAPEHQVESGFGGRLPWEPFELDGIAIDGPEAVCEHMERVVIQGLERAIGDVERTNPDLVRAFVGEMKESQRLLGPDILRVPYGFINGKPVLRYFQYGYEWYLMFYALYPTVQAEAFRLEGELSRLQNQALAAALIEHDMPRLVRWDHDMTDSRGSLVDMDSLDRMYFPAMERAAEPLLERGIRIIWHCDGNVNDYIPRLLDIGFSGFQGFQYECGVDYPAVAEMSTRDGEPLTIIAGGSVTTTLVHGTPEDVHREVDWVVENSGDAYLALGGTSSICPGTPHENIDALLEAIQYYQETGKAGLRQRVGREWPFGKEGL